jgi:hypothetical protein
VPFRDAKGRTIGVLKVGGAKDIDNTLVIKGSPGKQLDFDLMLQPGVRSSAGSPHARPSASASAT